jgi:polygalacturonase
VATPARGGEAPPPLVGVDASIRIATGSGVGALPEPRGPFFDVTAYGAVAGGPALANQAAIHAAIDAARVAGGGTVRFPEGVFTTYTIRLQSHVGLHLASPSTVLRAAIAGTGPGQDGGFYDAPEPNRYVGLQDHGHSHFANSLIYGAGVDDVMISGPGLIDGSRVDASGKIIKVLVGNDLPELASRTAAGEPGIGNKAIAIKGGTHIVFRDFSIRNGGHFAILGTGIVGWTLDGLIVDTNRDALDVDASENVTIRNSTFNSLTDDAIVLKSTFALGRFVPTQNVLIENCTVSGYDAGSVIARTYTTHKLVATDRDGPTARIKLGTEGTGGFNTVTIRHVSFDRSRGFALESVDGAELRDIVLRDVKMKNVSSSPIFVRLGDRGRIPVTGMGALDTVGAGNDVRLDEPGWVLPNVTATYGSFPPVRFVPSYTKRTPAAVKGQSTPFDIVNPSAPTRLNPRTRPDPQVANAVGGAVARVRNISIDHVTVEDADPRYPILIAGLVDNPIENVSISNVSVEYRGGLKMEHVVEQRRLDQVFDFTAYQAAPASQSIPWLVNSFFSKAEALLPRIGWSPTANGGKGGWEADPYNVPEMPREYPEPSNFGILPAYGLYARHVRGLTISNVKFVTLVEDERAPVVLDDVAGARFEGFSAEAKAGVPTIVTVTNAFKRPPVFEYVKDLPYQTTTVTGLSTPPGTVLAEVQVSRPAPGTPPDSLYPHPTAPSDAAPYAYALADADYPKPLTVYRPYFEPIAAPSVEAGKPLQFRVQATGIAPSSRLKLSVEGLPAGAAFDSSSGTFRWQPDAAQIGRYDVTLVADDGALPVKKPLTITVTRAAGKP